MAERDNKGHFLKGHARVGVPKPGSNPGGHPKSPKGIVRDALLLAEDAMPSIIAAMIRTAKGEDDAPAAVKQAAREYLCDRIYGRPNQPLSGTGQFMLVVKDWTDKHE